ncbi:kinesin-associated protein 3 [Coccinella septempunctata]|uniref:kinesin-associated protein 3 n=1 Tax=Coccinella septempunctata TaxID=41139 RepID=UPI001D08E594|nr:kinesin-associated protein 3 [Coccinella septempunctata]
MMDPDDARFMKTDRRPGTIDVHPNLNAIVLNYEIEVNIVGARDIVLHSEKKSLKKVIELPMLNSRSDCLALAREVVNHCDLIHHSRVPEVEQTIFYLKKRKLSHGVSKDDKNIKNVPYVEETVQYSSLMDYIDLLYEGMTEKIKGAHQIQLLARDPNNLEALSKNETVISALGRVLREDWKRSIVLSTHLVYTFFCFSMYSIFHEVILKCKVGSICMDIIDHELRRYDKWTAELQGQELPPASDIPIIRKSCPNSASMSEIPKSRIPEPVRPKSGNFSDTNFKAIMEGSVYEDLTMSTESIGDKKLSDAERAKRYRTLIKKQENLLRICFYLLLNIAEDESIEEKMTKRNIVGLLVKALERENEELLVLVLSFLKKLSIMQCNKDSMADLNIVEKLPRLLDFNRAELVHLTLKLLYNLSFDNKLRYKMIKSNFLPKLISLLSDDRHQEIILKLLYHLSYDDEVKPQFIDSVGLIMDMLLLNVGNEGDQVMIALCINLAVSASNAQQMVKKNRLGSIVTRAFTYQNTLLMKMLHNISEHTTTRALFVEFVGDIAKAVVESKDEDFVRECIGILSNLNLPELDWAEIFKHFNMITWVEKTLKSNSSDVQLILEIIVLLGTAATDEGCSKLLCESRLMKNLIELLKTHQEDDEIVLQILYVFYMALSNDNSIDYLIESTEAPAYLIDLLQDNNKAIREVCNTCLNIISERNKSWGDRIKIEKFRQHNSQWLEMVDSQQLEPEEEEDDDELPPYLNTEYLSTAVVPPLSDMNDLIENGDDLNIPENGIDDYFDQTELIQDFEIESM